MKTQFASQLISFASAVVVTLAMLGGVNTLATSDTGAAQMAQSVPAAKA